MEQPAFRSGRITCWPVAPQHVGALRHKVHAAKDDVLRVGLGRNFRELVAVAGEVGKADHFVALVVVAQQNRRRAQLCARRGNARVHGVVGQRQVVFEAATAACLRRGAVMFVKNQVHNIPPSVLLGTMRDRADGDVESQSRLQSMRCPVRARQLTGMLQPLS